MTNTPSIASVTVAFNGESVLPKQLSALRQQTLKLAEIVVVDNASSDKTVGLLEKEYPDVTLLRQCKNGGVGGGYHAGLEYAAYKKKYDWILLLDQDSVPAADAIEQMIRGLSELGDNANSTAALASVCTHPIAKMNYVASTWQHGLKRARVNAESDNAYFVDSVISSGTLLRREAVENVGLPRADFFMDFVDHEYCLRLRRHGYTIAVVPKSRLDHAIGDPIQTNILGVRKRWSGHAPWREYYMTRNEIFTVWKYFPDWRTKCNVGTRLLRHACAVLLFGKEKLACLAMMYRGATDGRSGRLGIRRFDEDGNL